MSILFLNTKTKMRKLIAYMMVFTLTCGMMSYGMMSTTVKAGFGDLQAAINAGSNSWSAKTITFNPGALSAGDVVVFTFPAEISVTAMTADSGFSSGTQSPNNEWTLAQNSYSAGSKVFTYTTASTPTAGEYVVAVAVRDSNGVVKDTGYVKISISNTVSVKATVAEALIMTLSNNVINFNVDPSLNNGRDQTQSTTITIKSNAWDGFVIKATLASDQANKLKGATNSQYLASDNDDALDNYLKISTTNPTNPLTGANTITTKSFGGTALANGTNPIFASATASINALTNSTTVNVAYDLNVDYLTPADIYAGTITYTATPAF